MYSRKLKLSDPKGFKTLRKGSARLDLSQRRFDQVQRAGFGLPLDLGQERVRSGLSDSMKGAARTEYGLEVFGWLGLTLV